MFDGHTCQMTVWKNSLSSSLCGEIYSSQSSDILLKQITRRAWSLYSSTSKVEEFTISKNTKPSGKCHAQCIVLFQFPLALYFCTRPDVRPSYMDSWSQYQLLWDISFVLDSFQERATQFTSPFFPKVFPIFPSLAFVKWAFQEKEKKEWIHDYGWSSHRSQKLL